MWRRTFGGPVRVADAGAMQPGLTGIALHPQLPVLGYVRAMPQVRGPAHALYALTACPRLYIHLPPRTALDNAECAIVPGLAGQKQLQLLL